MSNQKVYVVLLMDIEDHKPWRTTTVFLAKTITIALDFIKERFKEYIDEINNEIHDDSNEDTVNKEKIHKQAEITMNNYRDFIPDSYYCNITLQNVEEKLDQSDCDVE